MSSSFFGILSQNERYADNREFNREKLQKWERGESIYPLNVEYVKEHLQFLEQFSPDRLHDRLVAHRVQVYKHSPLSWTKKGKSLIPSGPLELLVDVDLSEALQRWTGRQPYREEVLEENVTHILSDGTEIHGKRIRKVEAIGANMEALGKYLIMERDKRLNRPNYTLRINRRNIDLNQPREYHITTYVTVDGIPVMEKKEIGRPVFIPDKIPYQDSVQPQKLKQIVFTVEYRRV